MKFREKAFVVLLIAFVTVFNIGIFLCVHYAYKDELSRVKQQAVGEAYFIRTSMEKDFEQLDADDNLTFDTRETVFNSYTSYYKDHKVMLELWDGSNSVDSTIPKIEEEREELNVEQSEQKIVIRSIDGKKYLYVASCLSSPYEKYKLVYAYDLTETMKNHSELVSVLVRIDIVVCFILAVILFLILGRLVKPLRTLSNATSKISEGDYQIHVQIKGKNEFADLAGKFNEMAQRIEENVTILEEEVVKKQQLIDNMAHELRTPLTAITGYAELLTMAKVSESDRVKSLQYIVAESKRLNDLSRAILYMADIKQGGLELDEIMIEELIEHLKTLFVAKKCRIEFYNNSTLIIGNRLMIESLVINLVENAIRASSEGDCISVSFFENAASSFIQVQDQGVGMTEEEIAKIAEPFYRVDKARSRKSGGVGLGVSLCNAIVTAHNGTINYESEKGKGTIVTVEIPKSYVIFTSS